MFPRFRHEAAPLKNSSRIRLNSRMIRSIRRSRNLKACVVLISLLLSLNKIASMINRHFDTNRTEISHEVSAADDPFLSVTADCLRPSPQLLQLSRLRTHPVQSRLLQAIQLADARNQSLRRYFRRVGLIYAVRADCHVAARQADPRTGQLDNSNPVVTRHHPARARWQLPSMTDTRSFLQ